MFTGHKKTKRKQKEIKYRAKFLNVEVNFVDCKLTFGNKISKIFFGSADLYFRA